MTQVSAQFQSEDDAGSHITHMTSSEKTPVLVTTVDISPGVSVTLQVFAGDDPASVAEAFCAEHGLADSVVGPLREHIEENMREEAGFDEAIRAIATTWKSEMVYSPAPLRAKPIGTNPAMVISVPVSIGAASVR